MIGRFFFLSKSSNSITPRYYLSFFFFFFANFYGRKRGRGINKMLSASGPDDFSGLNILYNIK